VKHDFDLFTIGGGSGGVRASRVSAGYGAKVAIAESGRFGGTCVNVGCIPKKLFSYAAHMREDFEVAKSFGWTVGEPRFDWATLLANKDREIARLNGVYERVLSLAGVEIMRGRSNEVFHLERLPRRVLLIGGGYIAVEFASIFNGLGVQTKLSYRGKRLLRGFDAELGERLAEEMAAKGVKMHFGAEPLRIAKRGDGSLEVELGDGSREAAELVMFATGRHPNSANLGLEAAGVELATDGEVIVDKYSKTSVDSIHAIGDLTNRLNLTPVATAEAMWLARTLFGNQPTAVDHDNVPTAIFANPNVATVGLSEEHAREKFGAVDVYKASFRALKLTLGEKGERTFMKLVVDRASQKVVGAHMLGADAGEVIQGVAIAVKLGATKAQFDATIGIHPTAAEEFVTLRERVSVG